MEEFILSLALGGGLLLTVAVFVAVWEQRRQVARAHWQPTTVLAPRAVRLDVDIGQPAPAGDQQQRLAALDAALGGMVRGPAEPVAPTAQSWLETRPMDALHARAEPEAG